MSWSIVYEDEYLAAIDKPPGLLVAPDRWDKEILNLADWVRDQHSPEWRNVHRLDRETSGVVLFAKSPELQGNFTAMFETHAVTKIYSALVRPAPRQPAGKIDIPLDADPRHPGRMRVAANGKPSRTDYETLETWRNGAFALLDVRPFTGRTHQIRVHLAAIAAPVLADPWYGDGQPLRLSDVKRRFRGAERGPALISRLALHARQLAFEHPVTHLPCEINAPWPADFERAVEALRRYAA